MSNLNIMSTQERAELADAFAFLGNSLLAPMSQTPSVGLDAAFWRAFPCFESEDVQNACDHLVEIATALSEQEDAVTQVSVEYTRLFVGPPKPAAFPWESYYVAEGVTNGFGEPTYQMQRLLRENGLAVSHEGGSQFADHIGLELLLLSEMLRKESVDALASYVAEHPGKWIDKLVGAAENAAPQGYIPGLLHLVSALLKL